MGEQHYPLDFTPQCPQLAWLVEHLDGWQFGEQGLIPAILDAIGTEGAMGTEEGVYIEFGAGDGETLPLTIDRLYQRFPYWCWLVEIDSNRRDRLNEIYPNAVICRESDWKAMSYRQVDCVVIDIDGHDSVVMREMLDAGVRPALLVVEHMDRHFSIGTSLPELIPQWMLGLKLESGHAIQDTAETLQVIAAKAGYERIGFNRCNSFFIRRELFGKLFR
jgi:hypothetical protein